MAVAILVASPDEADQSTAIGLDFAAQLDQPLAILCLQPDPVDSKKKADAESGKSRSTKKSREKSKPGEHGPELESTDEDFHARTNYVDLVREHVTRHLATVSFGFVLNDVIEVPNKVDELRRWLAGYHEAPHIGDFHVETLIIPLIRGPGVERFKRAKDRLFETSRCETIYVCVDKTHDGRLPLDNIGVTGQGNPEIWIANRLARRLSDHVVRRVDDTQRDPEQQTVIVGIAGKANQTRVDNNQWNRLRKDVTLPVAMIVNPADSWWEQLVSAFDEKLRQWFDAYQMSREKRVELSRKLENGTRSSPEFILFMAIATFLACIGLIQDSAAVIIGAMLVAPLMTPLLGAGLSMIYGNKPLFWQATRSIFLGVAISFVIGTLVGLLSLLTQDHLIAVPRLLLTNEMISRSQPNMLDPFVGLAAGLAGGFAIGRDGQIGTVAGVAIAAALVPPIATAGLEAALTLYAAWLDGSAWTVFQLLFSNPAELLGEHQLLVDGARSTANVNLVLAPLTLFVLNACATIIGAFFGLRMVGMHRTKRPRDSRSWVTVVFLALLLAMIAFLMILPALALRAA